MRASSYVITASGCTRRSNNSASPQAAPASRARLEGPPTSGGLRRNARRTPPPWSTRTYRRRPRKPMTMAAPTTRAAISIQNWIWTSKTSNPSTSTLKAAPPPWLEIIVSPARFKLAGSAAASSPTTLSVGNVFPAHRARFSDPPSIPPPSPMCEGAVAPSAPRDGADSLSPASGRLRGRGLR